MADPEIILEVRDLHIEFHDHDAPETAVEDFDLVLHKGEILGLVGESGSGKSLSALAIAGLLNRHSLTKSGQILYDGVDLLTCDRERLRSYQGDEIAIIFQEPMTSLDPLQRIGYQMEEALRIHHKEMSKEERYGLTIRTMREVGLPDPERVYRMFPHELSGGMIQRVMIGAGIIGRPQILIADEPTTALDVTIQAQIIALLRKINAERGTAMLFISHDLSLVRQLCHHVIVMQQGRIVEAGATEDIFQNPQEEYTKALIDAIPKVDLDEEVPDEASGSEVER
ncbi:MAG: ABC transporter ATP-binding protein [Atopobiaceae bacterium]|nr:ABC transporter ATP-binding protein [Atopobiaceae bacterium]